MMSFYQNPELEVADLNRHRITRDGELASLIQRLAQAVGQLDRELSRSKVHEEGWAIAPSRLDVECTRVFQLPLSRTCC